MFPHNIKFNGSKLHHMADVALFYNLTATQEQMHIRINNTLENP